MKTPRVMVLIVMLCTAVLSGRADTIYLNDGTEINGTIVEESDNIVVVRRKNGTLQSYRRADVETVLHDGAARAKPAISAMPREEPKPAETKDKADADKKDSAIGKTTPEPTKNSTEPGKAGAETAAKDGDTKKDADTKDDAEKDDWSPPPGLTGFPNHAKRMSPDKEKQFKALLESLSSTDDAVRRAVRQEIVSMGAEVLPYVVTGIQHANVETRATCMAIVGQLGGKTAIKQVIEVFYSAMPESDQAASWQVPFIRAVRETLPAITGQSFISVQPESALVQNGLKQYIAWYNENYDKLEEQLGEKKIDKTDPDYAAKLKKARELKLEKKSWPRPPTPSEITTGKPQVPASSFERPADRALRDSIPTISREHSTDRQR